MQGLAQGFAWVQALWPDAEAVRGCGLLGVHTTCRGYRRMSTGLSTGVSTGAMMKRLRFPNPASPVF